MEGLDSDFDRLFGDFPRFFERRSGWMPAIDVMTRGEDMVIRAELPGIDPEQDVDITVQNGVLRNVLLPERTKEDAVKATYDRGILEVVVQGAVRQTGRKIPIQLGERQALTVDRQAD